MFLMYPKEHKGAENGGYKSISFIINGPSKVALCLFGIFVLQY